MLLPLIDINPDIYLPKKGYAKDLIKNCLYKNIKRTIKINERFDF